MSMTQSKPAGALYYPYIHIQDPNWLRANLLIFPRIKRMVPEEFVPIDSPEIREFTIWQGNNEPLLQPVDLNTERSLKAQRKLASMLQQDARKQEFLTKYGQDAARSQVDNKAYGFQIHARKLSPQLRDALKENRLSWEPLNPELYSNGYIEVHPRVGEAVMSTIAIACAQGEGLDVVGDSRSGPLHRCLLEKDIEKVYTWWLGQEIDLEAPQDASGEELMEFILGIPGDLSALTPEKLREIASEREPIDNLVEALREHAARIPAMDGNKEREQAFQDEANKVMKKWQSDKNNLSGFARTFFCMDSTKLATDFANKVADKTLTGLAAGTLTKATATAAAASSTSAGWLGSLAAGGIVGAGAGLIIGLIAHTGKTLHGQIQREKNSPYRFLTTLEDAGVVFRSEARSRQDGQTAP
jgi:hypothetical protein